MADFRPESADFRPERADSRPERADFRPERVDFRPERVDFRPERADFRPKKESFRPERVWGGRMDGQTNESSLCSTGLCPFQGRYPKGKGGSRMGGRWDDVEEKEGSRIG